MQTRVIEGLPGYWLFMSQSTQERSEVVLSPARSGSLRVQFALEMGKATSQVASQYRSGLSAIRHARLGVGAVVLVLWLLGIAGDAYTTTSMMALGPFEEANPAAAHGMNLIGVVPYVAVASLLCLVLAIPGSGSFPRLPYARLLWITSAVIAVLKCVVAAQNLHLWTTGTAAFGLG